MFAIGPLEIALIVLFGLIFVGPQKLPELAKQFGKFFVQMKRMTADVRHTVDGYLKEAEEEILQSERDKIKEIFKDAAKPMETIDAELKDVAKSTRQAMSGDSHKAEGSVAMDDEHHQIETATATDSQEASNPKES